MLTRTSETAIHALLYLVSTKVETPTSPGTIAAHIDASPSYLAKITSMLVKADILTAYRGVNGGVRLNRRPEQVTLLDVVQACQGNVFRDFSCESVDLQYACAYHKAMHQVQDAMWQVLSRWTLADLLEDPKPIREIDASHVCRLECVKHLFRGVESTVRA